MPCLLLAAGASATRLFRVLDQIDTQLGATIFLHTNNAVRPSSVAARESVGGAVVLYSRRGARDSLLRVAQLSSNS